MAVFQRKVTTMKIPLSQHLQTLANREELVGLKVWGEHTGVAYKVMLCYNEDKFIIARQIPYGYDEHTKIENFSIDLTEQEK